MKLPLILTSESIPIQCWEHVGNTLGMHWEHVWNVLGTPSLFSKWEHVPNTLGTPISQFFISYSHGLYIFYWELFEPEKSRKAEKNFSLVGFEHAFLIRNHLVQTNFVQPLRH